MKGRDSFAASKLHLSPNTIDKYPLLSILTYICLINYPNLSKMELAMATTKEIKEHLKIALKEIGKIKPWFSKEFNAWLFSHPNYPVEYAGESKACLLTKMVKS